MSIYTITLKRELLSADTTPTTANDPEQTNDRQRDPLGATTNNDARRNGQEASERQVFPRRERKSSRAYMLIMGIGRNG